VDEKVERVTIPDSEVRMLDSLIISDTYRLSIALPVNYTKSERTYPVVYLTYGDYLFPLLWFILNSLNADWELPRLILVGIGYNSENPITMARKRERDFLPTNVQSDEKMHRQKSIYPGQADNFLQYILDELKPFIQDNYRADSSDSTYIGHSHGGLFGLYTLFHRPDTFNRYVISSPSIHYDNEIVLSYEQNFAEYNKDLKAKVYISAGEREEVDDPLIQPSFLFVSNVLLLSERLKGRQYPGLQLNAQIIEGETHASVMPVAFSRGLRWVFNRK
jgi:hypothetical protein